MPATFAFFGGRLGSLIEAVNLVGSLFYGSLLGVFVLAFGFPSVTGRGAFTGLVLGEIAILLTYWFSGDLFPLVQRHWLRGRDRDGSRREPDGPS